MLSLCFEGLGLIDIDPRHQPVKLPPGKIPDLRLFPGPLITAADRQALIDQNETIAFLSEYSDKKAYPQPFVIRIFLPFILRYARFPEKNMRIKIILAHRCGQAHLHHPAIPDSRIQ